MAQELFRKSLLDRLTSPEQLDKLLVIVRLKGWATLITILVLLFGVIIWSFTGTIPITVSGNALLFDPTTLKNIHASAGGMVKEIRVGSGDQVKKEETVITLQNLEQQEGQALNITAPSQGTIVQILVEEGEVIPRGTLLFSLQEPVAALSNMKVYAFIPLQAGEKIKPGMDVQVGLNAVDPQKYGLVLGTVSEVFPYPVSTDSQSLKLIPSRPLRNFLTSGETTILVIIDLKLDASTPSGYAWTTTAGPPDPLAPGELGFARIFIEDKKPISYVIPIFQ